jgi:tetratricopeptide (TPR) repeat protein
LCHRAINLFGSRDIITTTERLTYLRLLSPLDRADTEKTAQLADQVLAQATEPKKLAQAQLVKGLAEYRLGHFAQAIEWLEKVAALPTAGSRVAALPHASADAMIACAQQQLNQTDKARDFLNEAKVSLSAGHPDSLNDLGANWQDAVITQVLVREASQLVGGTATK